MRALFLLILLLFPGTAMAIGTVHHDMTVTLDPMAGTVAVTDRITLPEGVIPRPDGTIGFVLAKAMTIDSARPKAVSEPRIKTAKGDPVPLSQYHVKVSKKRVITLKYNGKVRIPTQHGNTPGLIMPDGAVLSGQSYWYPQFGDGFVTFNMKVTTRSDWRAISQGARISANVNNSRATVTWEELQPQDEIHLVAGPLFEYNLPTVTPRPQVFLRTKDPDLADRYLTATARYLSLYETLIGPYPYAKFALVENFWETGWGMPSFTLMGPSVIRLPFMVDTAYPHEILHNWWGNGVFTDYDTGNWSEGLTAYLADHYLKQREGKGRDYRRDALVNFWNYVGASKDMLLIHFTSRSDRATQAIGYGKGMMLFHMLRIQLGDDDFFRGLTEFYKDYRFKRAGYDDLRKVLSRVSGRDLRPIFTQWTRRLGGPELAIENIAVTPEKAGHQLRFLLRQTHKGNAFLLYIPAVITLENGDTERHILAMKRGVQTFRFTLPAKPVKLAIDPDFDVFRKLDTAEIPPALSGLFGADSPLFILPAKAPKPLLEGYRALAKAWDASEDRMILDRELTSLPAGRPVWVLGDQNRFAGAVGTAMANQGPALLTDAGVVLPEGAYDAASHGVALITRDPERNGAPLGWVAAPGPEYLSGLARKLPHYGKYGYTVFTGDGPNNVLKGSWPAGASPLTVDLP